MGLKTFLVDKEDLKRVKKHTWYLEKSRNKVYYRSRINGRLIRLHRFVLNVYDSKIQIDHINGDTFDNRKQNLRLCNAGQNQMNRPLQKNNTSGYKGVCLRKSTGRWQAGIRIHGKQIHLGYFATEVEAAEAYNKSAIEYYGEFAKLNEVD